MAGYRKSRQGSSDEMELPARRVTTDVRQASYTLCKHPARYISILHINVVQASLASYKHPKHHTSSRNIIQASKKNKYAQTMQ